MNRPPIRLLGLLAFGALLAQAGHLIAYQLEFGATAQAVQSQGAHAYFPGFAKTSLGLVAAALLASLLLIGIARFVPGRPVVVTSRAPSYISLLAVLFTVQLVSFMAQETIESLAAGDAVPSALNLILLGSAGQLPVAAFAALALKWLAVRVDAALLTLRAELAVRVADVAPASLLVSLPALVPVSALAETCPTVYTKRGPPAILRA
ncbi:MAG: hypothetical protein WB682_11180 [Candidatus Dormiibacterota bacterium]